MTIRLQQLLDEAGPDVKACCTALYEHEWASLLLGESFHPGGIALTERLGQVLELTSTDSVLDVACGRGRSTIHLATATGCEITGIDLSASNIGIAKAAASSTCEGHRMRFLQADAEALPFENSSFDAVICECALCTFPDKRTAVQEIFRILKPGGRFGLSDVIRDGPLPKQLDHILGVAACVADARSVRDYSSMLLDAGFSVELIERHDSALRSIAGQIHTRLIGAQVLIKTGQIEVPNFDLTQARQLLRDARDAIAAGTLGYGLFIAMKPPVPTRSTARSGSS
ncbi:MAG: DVU_1556 family methyltransferase [Thermomicrobiales bacterium]